MSVPMGNPSSESKINQPKQEVQQTGQVNQPGMIARDKLVEIGKEHSVIGLLAIGAIFGKIEGVQKYVENRYYKTGTKLLKKKNWSQAQKLFKPANKQEKQELNELFNRQIEGEDLNQYILISAKTGFKSKHYIQMQQWRMRHDLEDEIAKQPTIREGLVNTSHWMNDYAANRKMDLNKLLENGVNVETLHGLNELKKFTPIKKEEFITLIDKAGGDLKLLNKETFNAVKETLDFVYENPFVEKRVELKSDPSKLFPAIKKYNEALKKATDLGLQEEFKEFSKAALEGPVSDKDFLNKLGRFGEEMDRFFSNDKTSIEETIAFIKENPLMENRVGLKSDPQSFQPAVKKYNEVQKKAAELNFENQFKELSKEALENVEDNVFVKKMERFGLEMSSFFSTFEDVDTTGVSSEDVKELQQFFAERIRVTDTRDNLAAATAKFKARMDEKGIAGSLENLREKKDAAELVPEQFLQAKETLKQAQEEIEDKFSDFMGALGINMKQAGQLPSEKGVDEKKEFASWVKEKGMNEKDTARMLKFLNQAIDKNNYNGTLLMQGLKKEIESKGVQKTMDGLFPKSIFGHEWDPEDLLFDNEGKTALLNQYRELQKESFQFQLSEFVNNAVGNDIAATPAGQAFANEMIALFKNQSTVNDEKALPYVKALIAFAGDLSKQDYSLEMIANAYKSMNHSEVSKNFKEVLDGLTKVQIIKSLQVQKDTQNLAPEAQLEVAPKVDISKQSAAYQKMVGDPLGLAGGFVTSFITTLFPNVKGMDKAKMQEDLRSFAPLLNPIVQDVLKDVDPELVDLGASVAKSYKGDLLGVAITGTKPAVRAVALSLVDSVVKANALYKAAKKEGIDLSKADDETVKRLGGTPLQKALVVDLAEVSFIMGLLQKINSVGVIESAALFVTVILNQIGGMVTGFVVRTFLKDNDTLTAEEKSKMEASAGTLVSSLLPIVPELLKKHDINVYATFITELNEMIHSDNEIDEAVLKEKINNVVGQLLDKELDQYIASISAGLESVGNALES